MSDRHEITQIIKTRVRIGDLAHSMAIRVQCPFCKSPGLDMQLYHDQGKFHCFHCDESGSVIDWVMKEQGLKFKDAHNYLADMLNLEIKETSQRAEIFNKVCAHFQNALNQNPEVIEYWESRGITSDSLYRYRVGYCTEDVLKAISKHPDKSLRVSWDDLEAAALVRYGKPAFPNHTTFPYRHWKSGMIMQYQGRFVGELSEGDTRWKGLKTESVLGNHNITTMLWGEEELRNYWRNVGRNGKTYAFLCEGVSDAITLRQQDTHALGLIGNQNLFQHHWKLAPLDVVYIIMDNDAKSQAKLPMEIYQLVIRLPKTRVIVMTLPDLGTKPNGEPIKQDVNQFFLGGGTMADLARIAVGSPDATEFLIDAWGHDPQQYEPLLTMILGHPADERPRLMDRLIAKQLFTRNELEAVAKIIRIPESPLQNGGKKTKRRG